MVGVALMDEQSYRHAMARNFGGGLTKILAQRAEHLAEFPLNFQNRREGLIGFQNDRRLSGLDSLRDRADGVSAHLHGLAGSRVSDFLPFGCSHPTGKEAPGIGMG